MYVPLPVLLVAAAVFVALAVLAFRRGSGDMIERQRRQTGLPRAAPPPSLSGQGRESSTVAPHNRPSDEAALLAVPEVRAALERGRKIEAIRHVRETTGLGLKESKELVERHLRRRRG